MIFPAPILRALLRSEVTQARRPFQPGEPRYRQASKPKSTGRSMVLVRPYDPKPGDRFPVQQRVRVDGRLTTQTLGHAIITSVTRERMGELTFEDAREMGYRTTADAMAAWLSSHDQAWMCEPRHSEECQACGGPGLIDGFCVTCGCSDQAAARFERKHADKLVWVIRFELDRTASERYLAETPAPDYVSSPALGLSGEGPGLSVAEHETHVQANADRTLDQWRTLERARWLTEQATRSFEERIERLQREAPESVNVDGLVWVLRQMLDRGAQNDVVERKLQQAEARVFRAAA